MLMKMDEFLLLMYLIQQDIEVFLNLIDLIQVQVNDESRNIYLLIQINRSQIYLQGYS
jgi:hypothetical protein